MDFISEKVLPQALGDLESRHESARELVQYLEDRYLSGKEMGENLSDIKLEGLKTVVETVVEVADDVNIISNNLKQMLQMENDTISSLTERVRVATARMRLSEEQYARKKLSKIRSSKPVSMDQAVACKHLAGVDALKHSTFERCSLKKRLNKYRDLVYEDLR